MEFRTSAKTNEKPPQPVNRRWLTRPGQSNRRAFLCGSVIAAVSAASWGCCDRSFAADRRSSKPEETETTQYIARICRMSGLDSQKIEGVALVTGLHGTGSSAKPGQLRDRLLEDLDTIDLPDDPIRLLESNNTEMVLVKGLLPPGVRKGDRFDLEIFPLQNTDAKTLEHGYIHHMRLRTTAKLGRTVKDGHLQALGRGRVLSRSLFETRNDTSNQLSGFVLGGGMSRVDRDLALLIRNGSGSFKTATSIAAAINERFTVSTSSGLEGVANPITDQIIELQIPKTYQQNVGRYAQLISNMAFGEAPHDRVNRLDQLEQDLQSPATCGLAAIRLESIGKHAIPALKRAVAASDLQVRFAASQSLAYLGIADGIATLEEGARVEPAFRWQAFAALTVLKNAAAGDALERLLHEPSGETRYGAVRAIRSRTPNDPVVQGQWLANDFRMCVINSGTEPLLHFTRDKEAEITVFNDSQTFGDKFLFVETGLTVKSNGDGTVSISTYSADDPVRARCSDRVSDVFATMTQIGYGYSTLLKLARQSMQDGTLNSRLAVDAVVRPGRHYRSPVVQSTVHQMIADERSTPMSRAKGTFSNPLKKIPAPKLGRIWPNSESKSASNDVRRDDGVSKASWWSTVKEKFER